jgi:hypothetical protein
MKTDASFYIVFAKSAEIDLAVIYDYLASESNAKALKIL